MVGPVAQLVRAGDSSVMVPSHRKVRSGRDEFREPSPASLRVADGNPEPSRRYTAGRCRDYLSASVALNDRLERPAPYRGEEIVHSLRKRRGSSESLGLRFESERAHHFFAPLLIGAACPGEVLQTNIHPVLIAISARAARRRSDSNATHFI